MNLRYLNGGQIDLFQLFYVFLGKLNRIKKIRILIFYFRTTPSSSTIYKTLLSISGQISELYNIPMTSYPTVNQLRDQLESNLLSQIPDNEYLLIIT